MFNVSTPYSPFILPVVCVALLFLLSTLLRQLLYKKLNYFYYHHHIINGILLSKTISLCHRGRPKWIQQELP